MEFVFKTRDPKMLLEKFKSGIQLLTSCLVVLVVVYRYVLLAAIITFSTFSIVCSLMLLLGFTWKLSLF